MINQRGYGKLKRSADKNSNWSKIKTSSFYEMFPCLIINRKYNRLGLINLVGRGEQARDHFSAIQSGKKFGKMKANERREIKPSTRNGVSQMRIILVKIEVIHTIFVRHVCQRFLTHSVMHWDWTRRRFNSCLHESHNEIIDTTSCLLESVADNSQSRPHDNNFTIIQKTWSTNPSDSWLTTKDIRHNTDVNNR